MNNAMDLAEHTPNYIIVGAGGASGVYSLPGAALPIVITFASGDAYTYIGPSFETRRDFWARYWTWRSSWASAARTSTPQGE